MTPDLGREVEDLATSMGHALPPNLRDAIVGLVNGKVKDKASRPRMSKEETLKRLADRRRSERDDEEQGAVRFMAERMVLSEHESAVLKRAHDQYRAFCVANNLPFMGKTTFGRWLVGRGFAWFPIDSGTSKSGYSKKIAHRGFSVLPDPAIDPPIDLPRPTKEEPEPDPDYVKPVVAGRTLGLASGVIYGMIKAGTVRTIPGPGTRPMVHLGDVRDGAHAARPAAYAFPTIGDYRLWLAERTAPTVGARMFHHEAWPDYRVWCGQRQETPISEGRFKDAVGSMHCRACVNGNQKMTYYGVMLRG